MTMMMKGKLVAAMVVLLLLAAGASAATCNARSLSLCAGALTGGGKPTPACCSNLRAQQSCFCTFAKNPTYGRYISSPNVRTTLASCGLAVPRC
jgi:hypothetical protein